MKIQDLAIIFVIIILPISLVLSAYAQAQIQTLNLQTLYDSQLTAATYDAIKAYQINAENSSTSGLAESKIRDVEASVATFKNSIMSSFRLNGYTGEELDNYIPALVYTMYDGFYIYSPYVNKNYQYEYKKDANGNTIIDPITNEPEYELDEDGNKILAQHNGESTYGLKPYITYSCRYKKGDIDVVITYSLENYITIQGMIGTEYINESGYLIDGIDVRNGVINYNDVDIYTEGLKEYLPIKKATDNTIPKAYPYIKLNGTKYYKVDLVSDAPNPPVDDSIIYLLNGEIKVQCRKTNNPNDAASIEFQKYSDLIDNNNQAVKYYTNALEFKNNVITRYGLTNLKYEDAYEIDGTTPIWPGNGTYIFTDVNNNIENELSNFNQHRLAVIRHKIETNLAVAISNYNNYSGVVNEFQMPELQENEWDYITHNISLISFLQGLNIGGKIYNGYSIVTNTESKEVVQESNIYILGSDFTYHKVGDLELDTTPTGSGTVKPESKEYDNDELDQDRARSAGRVNLDFKRKMIKNNDKILYYYPLQEYNASYKSVIMEEAVVLDEDDMYAYVDRLDIYDLECAFYTAIGRERMAKYNANTVFNINNI